mgnify:CR=1 FL=1
MVDQPGVLDQAPEPGATASRDRSARTRRGPIFPIEVRWPTWVSRGRRSTLQDRLIWLTALTVAATVSLTGLALYLTTRQSLYDQLDAELVQSATQISQRVGGDITSAGGLNADALRSANVVLVIVQANLNRTGISGETVAYETGAPEVAIARSGTGYSARTVTSTTGEPYRIVAVPSQVPGYALVLGRRLTPTLTTLRQMWTVLAVVAVVGILAAALSGLAVARSSLTPVRRLTEAVTYITETDELTPIDETGPAELAELTGSFNSMVRSLASSRERQRRLIADASHELRTPLTSLRTNVELLVADERSGMLPEGARADILRDVAAQVGEFSSLVGDLVQLSREGRDESLREVLDLQDVVANAVTRAKRRGPSMFFDVTLDPHMTIGNAATLERAFTNLLDNAVKFSPQGSVIKVAMADDLVKITDEGPGIAEEDLPHVFERFYRSDLSRNTPGTGLGLSIVAHTINAHGGWVKAGAAPGGGAEFTVYLPRISDVDVEAEV